MVSVKVPEEWLAHSRCSVHAHHRCEVGFCVPKLTDRWDRPLSPSQPSRRPDRPLREFPVICLSSPLTALSSPGRGGAPADPGSGEEGSGRGAQPGEESLFLTPSCPSRRDRMRPRACLPQSLLPPCLLPTRASHFLPCSAVALFTLPMRP